jgi:hypothetical protein
MTTMLNPWTHSPQSVDPLSWFAGPRVPMVLSIVAVAQGLVITILYWNEWSNVLLQLLAMPFFLSAGWIISRNTMPHRQRFGHYYAAIVLLIAFAGVLISSAGTVNSTMPIQQWWPGIAIGVTLASLAPFSSARSILIYSVPVLAGVAAAGVVVFVSLSRFWPPLGIFVISTGPVLVSTLASSVFCYSVLAQTNLLQRQAEAVPDAFTAPDDLSEAERTGGIARLSSRVAPFLEQIVDAGVITQADRTLAAQIARGLRTDLVTASSRSWLDTVALKNGVAVSDPARLADTMNEAQRTALRALIVTATENAVVDRRSVLVELRAQPDGSTAVAISIDVDLEEGRRMMLLAPYYLTLQTTVDDLSWADGESLLLRFKIPPRETDR